MHKIEISGIQKNSIAEELGLEKGDYIVSINQSLIRDVFDYRFLCANTMLTLEIEKKNGENWQFEIEKDEMEDLGIEFKNSLLDQEKSCKNKCIFCFIDQLPKGMRKTLYFKDDDARLSFLFGNYITMTNLSDSEIDRIINYRMSPVNISVHTTNPQLRIKMLNNRFAGDIIEKIRRFVTAGILVNAQIVLCPGINDNEELDRTLSDLTKLCPGIKSISVVPVGLTKYREGLYPLKPFTPETANMVIDQVYKWQHKLLEKFGSRIVYLADEFFILAGRELPSYEEYEDFPQIENGVGMVTSFMFEVDEALNNIKGKEGELSHKKSPGLLSIATGKAVFKYIQKIVHDIEKVFKDIRINVYPVENTFFGSGVTVTGLLIGKDLIRGLKNKNLGQTLLLCSNMFKSGTDILLDDITVPQLENILNIKIQIVDNNGHNLIDTLVRLS